MKNLKKRKYKSGRVSGDFIAIMLILFFVVAGFCAIIFSIFKDTDNANDSYKQAYGAWVKQDGNSKNLTYDEWRSLIAVYSRFIWKENKQ